MDYERKLLKQSLQTTNAKKKKRKQKIEEKKLFCVTAKCGIVLTKGRVQVVIVYIMVFILHNSDISFCYLFISSFFLCVSFQCMHLIVLLL